MMSHAHVFTGTYRLTTIGLHYFNAYSRHQDSAGAYALVIPCWAWATISGEDVFTNRGSKISFDLFLMDTAVRAIGPAATTTNDVARNQVYNVEVGEHTSIN